MSEKIRFWWCSTFAWDFLLLFSGHFVYIAECILPCLAYSLKKNLREFSGQYYHISIIKTGYTLHLFRAFLKFCGFKAGMVKRATNWKRKTYFATLLQTSWKALLRFLPPTKKKLCKTGSKVGGKTFNISNQLVLRKCCKSISTFFLALYRDRKSHRVAHFFVIAGSKLCDFSGFFHELQK